MSKPDWKHKNKYCTCIVSRCAGGDRCANCGKLLRPLHDQSSYALAEPREWEEIPQKKYPEKGK